MDFNELTDGDPLPLSSHVTKLVKNSQIHINGEEKVVDGLALIPRSIENYLSVNWLEFNGNQGFEVCLQKILEIYRAKREVRNNQWLPVINTKKAIDYIKNESEDQRVLRILYKPEMPPAFSYEDPSHSGVYGYSHEDALIGDLLCEVVESLTQVKDFNQ